MNEYAQRITVICPDSMRQQGNHLAAAIGESVEDLATFDIAPEFELDGIGYTAITTIVSPVALVKAGNPLVRPYFDEQDSIDMVLAEQGREAVRFFGHDAVDFAGQIVVFLDKGLEVMQEHGFTLKQPDIEI